MIGQKIIRDVCNTVLKFGMIEKGDSILISISGGPDSVFLAHFLSQLKNDFDLELSCFHLDHRTRNGQSAKDSQFVSSFCKEQNLRLFKEEIDCERWCRENRLSFQEGARILRMDLLKKISGEHAINKIAVGHTADDSIETFFLHLIRGSGLSGLAGIAPVEGHIIRPLIETRRKDISHYLKKNSIEFCVDISNLENKYERNKVRNLLVPFIKDNFSDSFDNRLIKTIEIIRDEDAFISSYAKEKLKEIASFNMDESGTSPESIQIPVDKLKGFPDSLKKRIFIESIIVLKGSSEDIKNINLEDLLELSFAGGGKKEVDLADGLVFIKESGYVAFIPSKHHFYKHLEPWEFKINIGSQQVFKQQGIKITSGLTDGGMDWIKNLKIEDNEAYMDYDKVKPPIFIRSWKRDSGEKFYPLGSGGSKKIHDFLIDEKIPFSKRTSIPVFNDKEKIIWVGKLRLDERVKLDKNTKKILFIKIFDI